MKLLPFKTSSFSNILNATDRSALRKALVASFTDLFDGNPDDTLQFIAQFTQRCVETGVIGDFDLSPKNIHRLLMSISPIPSKQHPGKLIHVASPKVIYLLMHLPLPSRKCRLLVTILHLPLKNLLLHRILSNLPSMSAI